MLVWPPYARRLGNRCLQIGLSSLADQLIQVSVGPSDLLRPKIRLENCLEDCTLSWQEIKHFFVALEYDLNVEQMFYHHEIPVYICMYPTV